MLLNMLKNVKMNGVPSLYCNSTDRALDLNTFSCLGVGRRYFALAVQRILVLGRRSLPKNGEQWSLIPILSIDRSTPTCGTQKFDHARNRDAFEVSGASLGAEHSPP